MPAHPSRLNLPTGHIGVIIRQRLDAGQTETACDTCVVEMRIISGKWRSRRLLRPQTTETRPVPDRVKESIFNILTARFGLPAALPPLRVADVFAGSGSMGLEALSRGAEHCSFFERGTEALSALRRNIEALGANAETTLVTADAWRSAVCGPENRPFDLVLLDPPYGDSKDSSEQGAVRRYLMRLQSSKHGSPLVVLHHRPGVRYDEDSGSGWRIVDQRTIGSNAITLFEK